MRNCVSLALTLYSLHVGAFKWSDRVCVCVCVFVATSLWVFLGESGLDRRGMRVASPGFGSFFSASCM